MRRLAAATTALAVALVSPGAHAAGEPGEVLFREGREALAAGDERHACEKFADAVALGEAFGPLANLGACKERSGDWTAAWALYERASRVARPESLAFAREARARAAGRIALVQIRATNSMDHVEVDGAALDPSQLVHPLRPGRHRLVLSRGTDHATLVREFAAGESSTWELPSLERRGRSAVGPALTIGGAAMVALGLVAAAVALSGREAASSCLRDASDRRTCPSAGTADEAARAKTFANLATIGVVGGLAVGGVGVGFWLARDSRATATGFGVSGAF